MRINKTAIRQGMKIPGMTGHINRLKGMWRNSEPSDVVLNTWIRHRVIRHIVSSLTKRTLKDVLKIYKELSHKKEEGLKTQELTLFKK